MNEQEKVACEMRRSAATLATAFILAFAIGFLLMFSLYLAADEQRVATMAIEDIPHNAVEDAAVKNQPIYWKDNIYKPEELRSVIIPDTDYFKVNPMDIKFFVDYKKDSGASSTIFIRGIKYSELPFVYDYEKEIDLEPADVVYKYHAKFYELKEFKVSKNPPWVVSVGYQKIGPSMGVLISVFFGIFALAVVWVVAIVFILVADIKKKK